ncbi:hypothetical protein H0H93_007832 [Arthromyces matolae]|nr:hypothetical protein H0H93_007832 [Arthromyces matolae]
MALPNIDIEVWLADRLEALSNAPPRYEASMYGPHNGLLNHFFPTSRVFLVKPQPKLRPSYEAALTIGGDDDDYFEENSFSSIGAPVRPRAAGGREEEVWIPDFIVALATRFIDADFHFLVVEVKTDDTFGEWEKGRVQLNRYLVRQMTTSPVKKAIFGLLICGGRAEMYRLKSRGPLERIGDCYSITDLKIRTFLWNLARDRWDHADNSDQEDEDEEDAEDEDEEDADDDDDDDGTYDGLPLTTTF